jgi:hypothetical protein
MFHARRQAAAYIQTAAQELYIIIHKRVVNFLHVSVLFDHFQEVIQQRKIQKYPVTL